ncbi:MAG: LysE family transporter [Alphaproteobacteria bacterium]
MENLGFLIKGLIIGLAIAAPVGPIGVLCILRTLADGRLAGLLTGLGAATADGVYGAVAAFGLTVVTDLLVGNGAWLGVAGGMFLWFLGVKTYLSVSAEDSTPLTGGALAGLYGSTFVLTLTNPTTILSFVAIFAGLGLGHTGGDYAGALVLVIAVFAGLAL